MSRHGGATNGLRSRALPAGSRTLLNLAQVQISMFLSFLGGESRDNGCMMTVLVDGNNVLPALGIRRTDVAEQLLQRLEMAAVEKDWEVTVVFDGPERYLLREFGPLIVRYVQGKTADSLIERMAYQAPDRSQLIVVTQDRAEADLVRGFGALVWSAQRLLEEIKVK